MMDNLQNVSFHTSTPDEIVATMLAELQETMGDMAEELLSDLIPMLLEDAPPMFAGLRQAITDGNGPKVKELAHTFKGSCASMGIKALAAHCQAIENMGRDNQLEEALPRLAHAAAEYEQVKQALNRYV
jgi:HPt (histidine-containing phosphotransfer) domain-containing protein